jgi:hypothetical protein
MLFMSLSVLLIWLKSQDALLSDDLKHSWVLSALFMRRRGSVMTYGWRSLTCSLWRLFTWYETWRSKEAI